MMTDQLFKKLREFLLTFDEEKRELIKKDLSENDFQFISDIKKAFLSDTLINKIIEDFHLATFEEEIKDLHAEFYLELAELYAEGQTNNEIEALLESDNQTFKKAVSLFPSESTFIKELSIAMDDIKTKKMIEGYAEIDKWLESKKSSQSQRAAANVIPITKTFKYAIAATLFAAIIGGVYLKFFNNKPETEISIAQNDSTKKTQSPVANIEIPNLIESAEINKRIIVDARGSSFAENNSLKDSININVNGLSKQIDSLTSIAEQLTSDKSVEYDRFKILMKLDSLRKTIKEYTSIINTYTYDNKIKKVVLNVPEVKIVKNIISINPIDLSQFYINIEDQYYLIRKSEKPERLYPITDKKLIDNLKRIEFSN